MNHDAYSDDYIRSILHSVKSIAMVGASPVDVRPSYFAFKYLVQRGYDMIPVNPGHVGKSLLGRPFVASLGDIGRPIDMVEIFRSSQYLMPVVDEALKLSPLPKVIWMQLGGRKGRGGGAQGRDEPLPENRIRPPLVRNLLDGCQFTHHQRQTGADSDPGHAAFVEPHERRRRRHNSLRPRCEKQERTDVTPARNDRFKTVTKRSIGVLN
jgi:predicted CoA-binding protein